MFIPGERQMVGRSDGEAVGEAFTVMAPRIRAALSPIADPAAVDDAVSEAFVYLCTHPERVLAMANPGGYLYRVARNHLRRVPRRPTLPPVPDAVMPTVDPGLPGALAVLSEKQRVVVYLIAGVGWTAREAGEFLNLGESTVRTHYDRGLAKLRARLGEDEE